MFRTFLATLIVATFTCSALAVSAQADEQPRYFNLPKGQSVVNLSATEKVTVDQDLLVASLYIEKEHSDSKTVQSMINKVMNDAVNMANKYKDIDVRTDRYFVHNHKPSSRSRYTAQDTTWRGRQGLTIKGKNSDDVLELVGKLQILGMASTGLNYQLSPEKMESTKDELLEKALAKLQHKAERTARALGKSRAELKKINIDTNSSGFYPSPVPHAEMAVMSVSKQAAPPVAAPGKSEISLTVQAEAIIE